MNETLKQFSDEVAKNLKAKIESSDFATFIEKVQKSADDRTFEVVMSTSDEDRQGDALDQSGWDFKYFDMNPVLLWAHNYQGFPIGIITDIRIDGDQAIATGKFAPAGLNPEADLACALYQEKILRAVSPGYIQNDDGTRELLEVSFCPVPAGRYALSLRQVRSIGLSTRELVAKGFFYTKKEASPPVTKTPVLGDHCELDDGTPGVLATDPKNPGTMVCVPPEEGKSKSNENNMNEELSKALKAEHDRHSGEVLKSIDEMDMKSLDAFETKIGDEQESHLEKCMKAVDEAYAIDPEEKSIDDFKKAIEGEHLTHVKCFDKAIEEFKSDLESGTENQEKVVSTFTEKAVDELARHEDAHTEMIKAEFGEGQDEGKSEETGKTKGAVAEEMQEDAEMQAKYKRIDKAYSVFSAFISAYLDEKTAVDAYDALLDEAVALMKDTETKAYPDSKIRPLIGKSGRAISAKNQEKIAAIIKSIEGLHDEHGKSTDNVIAALKELMGSPEGDEGKETEEKSRTPNARSSSSRAAINKDTPMSELETYLFTQRLLRQAKTALDEGLRLNKEKLKEKFPSRR